MSLQKIRNLTGVPFETKAYEIYRYQYEHVAPFKKYLNLINRPPSKVSQMEDFGFLPIDVFKTEKVLSDEVREPEITFTSSGTTQTQVSKHHIDGIENYLKNSFSIFSEHFENVSDFFIVGLLPAYLSRKTSSLVYMVEYFQKQLCPHSKNFESLKDFVKFINEKRASNPKFLIFGVSFALVEVAQISPNIFQKDDIVIETGGMKSQTKELSPDELQAILKTHLGTKNIHSEYGMTELLSQSYSDTDRFFSENDQLKILIRDLNDPLSIIGNQKQGGINIIDLANVHSCSFIATDDLGIQNTNKTFQVLGRMSQSEIKGCSSFHEQEF